MINSISIKWEVLGAQFAGMSDDDQGAFFSGMARELRHWDSTHQKQMQGAMVSDKLTEVDKKELETFLSMLWLKE